MDRAARGRPAGGIALALATGLIFAAAAGPTPQDASAPPVTARGGHRCPPGAPAVPAGVDLQPAVDAAPHASALCLAPGIHQGPVVIRTSLALHGPPNAVIRSTGEGTTVRVLADSVTLAGFTVEGSGRRYDLMDAAVYARGDGTVVRDLIVRDALFGIVVERSNGVLVSDNRISGLASLPVGIRGDGIRLWEVRASTVEGNRLEDSRDILIWYSPGNRIEDNTVLRSRYGTHFMYSDDSVVEGNDYRDNVVGVFVMYSRGITLRNNVLADNSASDGMGLGVKESGNLLVEDNELVRDHACVYLETSPFRNGDSVVVRNNTMARCTTGVRFHSSETDNTFLDNVFAGNQVHVAVEGRGTAQGVTWRGNYFDDYGGFDLDGDGFGDVAYELRSLSERLVTRRPELAFFRGTFALELLDLAAQVFPVLQSETLLVDPRPRMSPPAASP